ncbi:hypothetical protein F2Q69_00047063 [Brassica cretica]|uniref:Uncharacterized protein n=1 Tax=Brassica cretica TaxID=69181 RepID=A0A8S9PKA5_BRACR|nr:hypothetical protein F2Q69_00047063 [Brassica cretica]
MMFLFMFGSYVSSRHIKTDRRLIGGYCCIGLKWSERKQWSVQSAVLLIINGYCVLDRVGLTGRQAVDELNGGFGAPMGGSERVLECECVLDTMAYANGTSFGALSMVSVLSVLDGWLETKPSLFVYLGMDGKEWSSKAGTYGRISRASLGRVKRTKDELAVRETGSGPFRRPLAVVSSGRSTVAF